MEKSVFGRLVDNPASLRPEEWNELQKERDRYPFSAPLQVLTLLADKLSGTALWEQQSLPRVALYMQSVDRLDDQLEQLTRPVEPAKKKTIEVPSVQKEREEPAACKSIENPDESPFDVLQEINAYQEVSFKTAPKSVILSNFLEKDGGITLSDDAFETVSIQELAKKSIAVDSSLGSETLAVVLEKQGKYSQALAMYEKLMRDNPEKSSTFAVRISALKAQLSEMEKG